MDTESDGPAPETGLRRPAWLHPAGTPGAVKGTRPDGRTRVHRHSTRRTLALAVATLIIAGGCSDGGDGGSGPDDGTTSPAQPSPVVTLSPTPTSGPTASPSPSPTGPEAQADGCPPARADRAAALPVADAMPTTDTRQITEAPSGRQVDVTLVTVSTAGPAGEQISAALEQHVQRLLEQWDETAGPPAGEDSENGAGPPPPELEVRLLPAQVDETVVSVVLKGFEYLGGASANGLTHGWVFSTATGEALALADVGLGGPCLDELGSLAADALVAEDAGMFEESESALRAGEISMDRWSLHDGSLHLHFPPYELAPGAAGPLTAELDLSAVRAATGTPLGSGT